MSATRSQGLTSEPVDPGTEVVVPARDRPDRLTRALVTNDDGIESRGLHALADAVAAAGLDVVVVAPDRNMSGAGTGIGQFDADAGVGFREVGLDGHEAYAIAGPPGLAVMSAALGAFGEPPDLIASGINAGVNTGHSVVHSGTVGAAIGARTFGCAGIAVSLAPGERWQWDTAARAAEHLSRWMVEHAPADLVLNVNVPALRPSSVHGVRWATLEEFGHFRVASADPTGEKVEFEIHGPQGGEQDRDTDRALVSAGFVTVTALTPISEADPPDLRLPGF